MLTVNLRQLIGRWRKRINLHQPQYGPLFFCSLLLTLLDDEDDDSTKGDRMDAPWKVHHKWERKSEDDDDEDKTWADTYLILPTFYRISTTLDHPIALPAKPISCPPPGLSFSPNSSSPMDREGESGGRYLAMVASPASSSYPPSYQSPCQAEREGILSHTSLPLIHPT